MATSLLLDHIALSNGGPTLSMAIESGQSLAILGPSASGKTQLQRIIAGLEPAARGTRTLTGAAVSAQALAASRRMKVQSVASKATTKAHRVAEALGATGLWAVRQLSLSDVSPTQLAAASLLEVLVAEAPLLLIDGFLDSLDPWCLGGIHELLRARLAEGQSAVVSTNRPDIAAHCDLLVVLDRQQIRFAGTPTELIRAATQTRLEVHTERPDAVRALVGPFAVSVVQQDGVLIFEAAEGQKLAARLLLEGYGDVQFVVMKQPSLEEALFSLIRPGN